ncbi:MAG: hypothetical protein O2856_04950, partial [Planctomycetota bacterium]|nr:hypothetical protein [Planctomycetota bacterium]
MTRPDGGVQANEAVLLTLGNRNVQKYELYYAPSHSVASALTVSMVVFIWQVIFMLCIRVVTLRLAPGLLGRVDEEYGYRSLQLEQLPSYLMLGSEVIT